MTRERLVRRIHRLAFAAALLAAGHARAANADPSWQVSGRPAVVSLAVVFQHDGATLKGTLYRPDSQIRVPAVVVLHGAEIGNASAALYRHLELGLPAIGIAVLVFDRRGSGDSSGSLKGVSYETLADDGIAGARALARLPQIDASRIGYWGLSQGGWLAVLAAKRDPQAAFAVSISAPLVTPEEQMEFAMSNRLQLNGYSDADVSAMRAARRAWTGYLRGNVARADAVRALTAIEHQPWFDLVYVPAPADLTRDPVNSSWRKQMDDDPMAAVRDVDVPVLFIYGGADPWVPVAQTLERIAGIVRSRPDIEYAVIAGANHEMMLGQHEAMAVDAASLQSDAPQAPAYFMLLASWLTRHALGPHS